MSRVSVTIDPTDALSQTHTPTPGGNHALFEGVVDRSDRRQPTLSVRILEWSAHLSHEYFRELVTILWL